MSRRLMTLMNVGQVLSLSLWLGGAVFFSFLVTPHIFEYLREKLPSQPPPGASGIDDVVGLRLAGNTVGAIFPTYFISQMIVGAIALVTGGVLAKRGGGLERWRSAFIAAALVVTVAHFATVYPHSIQILDQHYASYDRGELEAAAELRKNFGMWHGISQLLNLVTIMLVLVAVVLEGCGMRSKFADHDYKSA